MIQAVQYGLVTAEASVQTQAGLCGFCGGQSGAGTFLTEYVAPPLSVPFHQFSTFIHSFIHSFVTDL
jgi:hypothetical protein